MTRFIGLTLFVALLFVAARGQQPAVKQIAPGVFFWQGDHLLRKPANCTWIVFRDYVLVIDANFPWGAREILPEIRKTTSKPIKFVFDTHYHSDHTFGNSLFVDQGATLVCSELCNSELRGKGKAGWDTWKETGQHSLEGARLEYPTVLFDHSISFDDGEHRVELRFAGGGHSKGDAVAYLPKEKILISGDLCVNWKWGNNVADPDGSLDRWIEMLDTFADWDVNVVLPGHGSPGTPATLRAQRDYLADLLRQVRSGAESGKTADQLAQEIDLSRHSSWGVNAEANGQSVRAVYRKVTLPKRR